MAARTLVRTAAAVTTTAVIGGLGTDVRSGWYARLDKPAWQPPGWAFGPAWTTLYALMAVGAARTIDRLPADEAREFEAAFGANLVLNGGWNWLFFKAHRPDLALAEIAVLEVSCLDLVRRSAKVDRAAAAMLTPYALWVGFASTLNASIWRRNR
ncbi:TspO/MBR family protein [Nocardioides sp.]|uniref:TspO/MBR family protein n=1 Tax=Nocardioides sp. TaxID=35761 RepID=UPI003D137370